MRFAEAVGAAQRVWQRAEEVDVEGKHLPFREQRDRGRRPHGMPHAEFVEDVRVGRGEVGDGVVAENQPLEHWLMDDAANPLLVGANRCHAGIVERGADGEFVDASKSISGPPEGSLFLPNGITTKQKEAVGHNGRLPSARCALRSRPAGCGKAHNGVDGQTSQQPTSSGLLEKQFPFFRGQFLVHFENFPRDFSSVEILVHEGHHLCPNLSNKSNRV